MRDSPTAASTDDTEEYRPVPGWPYEVSRSGRVRRSDTLRTLKHFRASRRYPAVMLCCKGKTDKTYLVHRLVAELWVPNPRNLAVVNHIDHNKLNCAADNLEWTTIQGNAAAYGLHCARMLGLSSQAVLAKVAQYVPVMGGRWDRFSTGQARIPLGCAA